MSHDDIYSELRDTEKDVYTFATNEIKSIFRSSANQTLLRKFNDSFKKDEDGKRRDWKTIEEN